MCSLRKRGGPPPAGGSVGAACGRPKSLPPRGEGGPQGRMRGRFGTHPKGKAGRPRPTEDGDPPWAASPAGARSISFSQGEKETGLDSKEKEPYYEAWSHENGGQRLYALWEDQPRPLRPPIVEQGKIEVLSSRRLALRRAGRWSLVCFSAAVGGLWVGAPLGAQALCVGRDDLGAPGLWGAAS